MVTTDRRYITVMVVLVVAATAAYMGWSSRRSSDDVTVGRQAVNIVVDGLNQTQFVLREHRGKVVVVVFMTTWCPACSNQIEVLKRLREEVKDVVIASIDVDVNLQPSALEEWVAGKGFNWFIGHSPEAALTYEVSFVPTVIVIDKKGIIQYRGGPTSLDRLRLLVQQFQ